MSPLQPTRNRKPARANVVHVAAAISNRSRSSIYRVMAKKMSSRPIQLAIDMAIEILREQEIALNAARIAFQQRCALMNSADSLSVKGNGKGNLY